MRRKRSFTRSLPFLMAITIVTLMGGTLWFLYQKSRPVAAEVRTDSPELADIEKKTVASGAIQPRQEVEIKPKVSGILRKLLVKPGDKIKKGDLLGEIEIIPDPVGLNDAELRLRTAILRADRSKRELDRVATLAGQGTLPAAQLDQARTDSELAAEEVTTAESRVQLMRSGALRKSKGASTQIESTVDGMVLSLPLKEGSSVINANSFNPGTTVAFVANMGDMIFKGTIDESEVGRLKVGMPVKIVIGALNEISFDGTLEFVAPKSLAKEGTTEFEIEAAFRIPGDVMVRAGYSANANIVLEARKQVMSIDEGYVIFERGKTFVEIKVGQESGKDKYDRRPVTLGLSDGLRVEVLDGVKKGDVLRKPDPNEMPKGGPQGGPGGRRRGG
jgi:HlyD family secretion protein